MEKFRDASLPMEQRVRELLKILTIEEKAGLLATHMMPIERLGIKEWFVGAEVARGYVSRVPEEPTTVFPQPIGMSGMFDTELMYKLGEIAGKEARILNKRHPGGHLMLWGPTVDMCRNPLWGRNEEAYGEDPFLTGQMSAAYTKGMAGRNGEYMMTVPTLKHFCADNNEVGRICCNANVEPRTKMEYYYKAFEGAIREGGAYSIMAAYNELSGVPGMINPDIQGILKDKWGLGFVVTDGGDYSQNVTDHHYGTSHARTLALAIRNGTDVMTDDCALVKAAALNGYENGILTEADMDKSIFNSMLARFRLGEFDEKHPYSDIDENLMECDEHKAYNHRAALEQFVLLKNDGLLPFAKGDRVAVIGINGNENLMDWYTGWSSYNTNIFDGVRSVFGETAYDDGCDIVQIKSKLTGKYLGVDDEDNITAVYEKADSRTHFKKSEYGHGEVTYRSMFNAKYYTSASYKADSNGTYRWFSEEILKPELCDGYIVYNTYFKKLLEVDENGKIGGGKAFGITDEKLFTEEIVSDGIGRAEKLAEKYDKVIVCTGNDPMIVAREMYDRTTLALPERQKALCKAVYEKNGKTAMVIVSSYPYSVNEENEYLPAILYTTHAGPELGNAFAKVISGQYNPAGRLAQTWYRSERELAPILDYDIIENDMTYLYYKGKPLYCFGYGLSYSKFSYSNFTAKQTGDIIEFSVDIKNDSGADGEEVVQIYFRPENPRVKRPLKQLCAFKRVMIKVGEARTVNLSAELKRFEFYDVTREKSCTESGDYTFMAGASCEDIRQKVRIYIEGEAIPARDMTLVTKAINYDRKANTKMLYSHRGEFHYMHTGMLFFDNADIKNSSRVQLVCGSTVGKGCITLQLNGKKLCEADIPPSIDVEDFVTVTADIDTSEITSGETGTLSVALSRYATLKEIRFLN